MFPDQAVAGLCVGITLFEPGAHGRIVVVVHHDLVAELGVHREQVQSVGQAGIAVFAALAVEEERFVFVFVLMLMFMLVLVLVQQMLRLFVTRQDFVVSDVMALAVEDDVVVMMMRLLPFDDLVDDGRETVGQDLDLVEGRRQAPQGFRQVLIALDLEIDAAYDFVERHLLLLVVLVLFAHLLQGIGHVEGKVLVLRVEDEGQLVAALGHLHEPVVLDMVGLHQPCAPLRYLFVLLVEFGSEDGQGLGEIALVEHGIGRDGKRERDRKNEDKTLFHRYKDTKSLDFC